MTESEWLASDDPAKMLEHLRNSVIVSSKADKTGFRPITGFKRPSDRKLRLFAVACCRQVWHLLADPRSRNATEVAERYADGEVGLEQAERAYRAASHAASRLANRPHEVSRAAWAVAYGTATDMPTMESVKAVPNHLPLRAKEFANLLQEIVGNPFRPVKVDSAWLTPQVLSLAQAAYEKRMPGNLCGRCGGSGMTGSVNDREACEHPGYIDGYPGTLDPFRLALVADALEEAGCPTTGTCAACGGSGVCCHTAGPGAPDDYRQCPDCAIPAHLRSFGPHVRGCWALDLILGKE